MATISTSRSRATGTMVSVIDNRDGGFDAGDLPWFTLCEYHGGVASHPTRKLAESWAPVPDEWCPGCQKGRAGQGYGSECIVELANGRTMRTDTYEDNPAGSSYVRVCDAGGTEIAYWTYTEWQEDPQLVMAAIIGAAKGGDDG